MGEGAPRRAGAPREGHVEQKDGVSAGGGGLCGGPGQRLEVSLHLLQERGRYCLLYLFINLYLFIFICINLS